MKNILRRHFEPFFKMLLKVLDEIDDDFLDKNIGRYQCWKLFYHPLYWMDFHLSKYEPFIPQSFHTENMEKFDIISQKKISKAQLISYCSAVEIKTKGFIEKMNFEEEENRKPDLEKLLNQFRHSSFHIGMLYTVIMYEKNIMLDTVSPVK